MVQHIHSLLQYGVGLEEMLTLPLPPDIRWPLPRHHCHWLSINKKGVSVRSGECRLRCEEAAKKCDVNSLWPSGRQRYPYISCECVKPVDSAITHANRKDLLQNCYSGPNVLFSPTFRSLQVALLPRRAETLHWSGNRTSNPSILLAVTGPLTRNVFAYGCKA